MRPTDSASWRFGWVKHRRDSISLEPRAMTNRSSMPKKLILWRTALDAALRLGQLLAQFMYFACETSPAAPGMLFPRLTPRQGHPLPRYFYPSSCQA